MFVAADDESEFRILGLELCDFLIHPHMQMGQPDDNVDALCVEPLDYSPRHPHIVAIHGQVVTIVATVRCMQCQRKDTDSFVTVLISKCVLQRRVSFVIAGQKTVIVAKPVESRYMNSVDQVLWHPRVRFVIANCHVQGSEIVQVIERLDHLLAVPEPALERWIEKVTGMQDADVPALFL